MSFWTVEIAVQLINNIRLNELGRAEAGLESALPKTKWVYRGLGLYALSIISIYNLDDFTSDARNFDDLTKEFLCLTEFVMSTRNNLCSQYNYIIM